MSATEIVDGAPGKKHGAYFVPGSSACGPLDCTGGKDAKRDGGCGVGCCTYYLCGVCGDRFKVEWPD